jgi:micrococcal nuclease
MLALAVVILLAFSSVGLVVLAGCSCGQTTSGAGDGGTPDATVATGTVLTEAPVPGVAAKLLQVIDGDTIRVRMSDGSEERVRYIGIDAPEVAHSDSPGEYLGNEATAHNAALLASGPLRLQTDVDERDDFGRLLAYVWAGEVFINERMVRDGYARARNYPPNLALQDRLWDAHDEAREAGIGIWSR